LAGLVIATPQLFIFFPVVGFLTNNFSIRAANMLVASPSHYLRHIPTTAYILWTKNTKRPLANLDTFALICFYKYRVCVRDSSEKPRGLPQQAAARGLVANSPAQRERQKAIIKQ
jgi:hypothetical protein